MNEPRCNGCGKRPEEILEYTSLYTGDEGTTPDQYVRDEEGTYNPKNGHFYCTPCYVKAGMPLGVAP